MLRFDKVEPVGIHPVSLGMYHHFEILLKRLRSTPIVVISKVLNRVLKTCITSHPYWFRLFKKISPTTYLSF